MGLVNNTYIQEIIKLLIQHNAYIRHVQDVTDSAINYASNTNNVTAIKFLEDNYGKESSDWF